MEWVVGTDRCGLHNYTALRGGYIHSDPYFREQVVKRYHKEAYDSKYVKDILYKRSQLNYPCVTDCAQFMFIDYIREIDKAAKFTWLIRKKEDCVKSLMQRVGEDKRIHPKGWNFKDIGRKKELIEWYYDEVNRIIGEKLISADYQQIDTYSMPKVEIAHLKIFSQMPLERVADVNSNTSA